MRERIRYRFDSWMSRGSWAVMALLGAATLVFVVIVAVAVAMFRAYPGDGSGHGFFDIVWGNLMRTLDPGTMGADVGWGFRILMLVVTIGGLIVVASLIGIISGAFDDKMVELRRGKSRVLETGHTVILGWNSQLFAIISELCSANESKRRSSIVVLADLDKVEMEETIRKKVPHTKSTSIICRRGNPLSQVDLKLASPETAQSVVILAADDARHPDAAAMKTVMALTALDTEGDGPTIIAELHESSNRDAAQLAGQGRATWILADELISRITVQTCLTPGFITVCTELLDFAGDEIYFVSFDRFIGSTYLDAQMSFADSTVVGLARNEAILLNPAATEPIGEGDQLIVISTDDTTIRPVRTDTADPDVISTHDSPSPPPERTLVLGCNSSLQRKLDDLASFAPPGSSIHVVSDIPVVNVVPPGGIDLTLAMGDTTDRDVLEDLDVNSYNHILVLAYRGSVDMETADAKTIVTLLHLRDLIDPASSRVNIVSEMLDDRNRELAEVTRADDFIVSDRLVSLLLSQISQNRALLNVFENLFSSGGSEVYLRPVELYVKPGADVDFYDVTASAARRQETAIGFRIATKGRSRQDNYGIVVNPHKAERLTFTSGDTIIVLAESSAVVSLEPTGQTYAEGA